MYLALVVMDLWAQQRKVLKPEGEKLSASFLTFRDENIEKIYSECTEIIFTDTIVQRKSKMEELADAFIIVPGGLVLWKNFSRC